MSKTSIVIGGCRIPVSQNIAANVIEIKKAIDWSIWNDVDIMLTPECALSGYLWAPVENDPRIKILDAAQAEIIEYSKSKKIDLILGTAGYHEGRWVNQLLFIVNGAIVHRHEKNLLIGMEDKIYAWGQGVEPYRYKGFTIAGLICNDAWPNPVWWTNTYMLRKLYYSRLQILFIASNVPRNVTDAKLMYNWHRDSVSLMGGAGNWNTVVSGSTLDSDGNKSSLPQVCPVGIVQGAFWSKIDDDYETSYFKEIIKQN
jgi:predicted amidohydrolase